MTITLPVGAAQYTDTLVSIDGLLLQLLDTSGVSWTVDRIDGWRMGGGVDPSFTARPGQHGTFDGPVYRRERVIALSGACKAPSRALIEAAYDTLAASLADGRMGTLAVQTPAGERWVKVRLTDAPQSEPINPLAFRWQLQFTAPDHRKYGEAVEESTTLPGAMFGSGLEMPFAFPLDFGSSPITGELSFTNTGTADTEPAFRVVGPMESGFEITRLETGQRLRYAAPVGTDVVIDNADGTASTEGQDRTSFLTVRDWFTVGPGESATFRFSTLGSEDGYDPPRLYLSASPAYH